jgi:hypothetical protein
MKSINDLYFKERSTQEVINDSTVNTRYYNAIINRKNYQANNSNGN